MIADPQKKTLIIVESPTKARTIGRYLPPTCTVMASKGHVLDLAKAPKSGIYGVDDKDHWKLELELDSEKKKLIDEMKKVLKEKEQLVLASDEDREGESISYQLYTLLKPKCPTYRMVFHEITRSAIENAFKNCREIDMNLVQAQEARRAVDRLQGYGISPIISNKLGSTYSAGRVQSPGLKLIVEREKERRLFKSSDYASVTAFFDLFKAELESISGKAIATSRSFDPSTGKAKGNQIVLTVEEAEKISFEIKGKSATVRSVERNEKSQNPPIPFTTSTLQQDGSRVLRKSVKEIMSIAQGLYERGYITYMRTDSPTLSKECIDASRKQIKGLYGEAYLSSSVRNFKASSQGAQEAHEAIRPAGDTFRLPKDTGLSGDDLSLYTLIWKRTLSSQMKAARKAYTKVRLESGEYIFLASGCDVLFDGYLRLMGYGKEEDDNDEERSLPEMKENDVRMIEDASIDSHSTEPPQRYNEASLVRMLEKEGIGRPSTYATIISTILDRGYAIREKGQLVPTFRGFFVSELLESTFPTYIGYDFTSRMEKGLDEIASGNESKEDYLNNFWHGDSSFPGLSNDLARVRKTVRTKDAKTLELDGLKYSFEHDGKSYNYQIKIGKFGPYLLSPSENSERDLMASIEEKKYFPGTFTDSDAEKILFKKDEDVRLPADNGILVLEGRYGSYLKRESDGKIANLPKRCDINKLDKEQVDFLFSLPKNLGSDNEGNEAILRLGPYGYYVAYKGKNIRVKKPESVRLDDIVNEENEPKNKVLRIYPDLDGKSLELIDGRYGAYIKWGDKNCALRKEEKENPMDLSDERVREIALSAPEKAKSGKRKTANRK